MKVYTQYASMLAESKVGAGIQGGDVDWGQVDRCFDPVLVLEGDAGYAHYLGPRMLRYVRPIFVQHNIINSACRNPKTSSDFLSANSGLILVANSNNVNCLQFGLAVLFAAGPCFRMGPVSVPVPLCRTPLLHHIRGIVLYSTEPQMSRIDTSRVVAGMANKHTVRDRANQEAVCKTRREDLFSVNTYHTSAVIVEGCGPVPTLSNVLAIHSCPEAFHSRSAMQQLHRAFSAAAFLWVRWSLCLKLSTASLTNTERWLMGRMKTWYRAITRIPPKVMRVERLATLLTSEAEGDRMVMHDSLHTGCCAMLPDVPPSRELSAALLYHTGRQM